MNQLRDAVGHNENDKKTITKMEKTTKIFLAAAIIFSFQFSNFNSVSAQDAEYQLIRRSYTVNNDGSVDIQFRKEIKLLRNRAITAYADKGETFILYNPAIDELTINESYTIRPDGSRVQTPANAFVDQLPSQCQDCGRYNGIRERAVIHTALEYNCIVVLDYTIHRRTPLLDESIILSEDCPIKKYEVIYNVKSDGKNGFETNNLPKSHKFIKKQSKNWHLVLTNIPQNYNDSYLPSPHTIYPNVHLYFGTMPTAATDSEPLPEAEHLIAELFDNDPTKFVTNIRDYVIDHIKTNDIPAQLLAYNTSSAKETFLSACGTPADKKLLLAAMLRQAGFNVSDDNGSLVVTIKDNNMEMDYRVSASSKRELRPVGAAIDEQRTIEVDESIPWQGVKIGGGYSQMELPVVEGTISINPARLTSDRKAPLLVRNCKEKYHYVIALPRTPNRSLVGEPVNINYSKPGIGSIRISIKQDKPGAGIEVIRELNIEVENGIVTEKQYKAFRQMIQDWNQYRTITIK